MNIEKIQANKTRREKVCQMCPNLSICAPYGGTCNKRESTKLFNRIMQAIKKYTSYR